MFPRSTCIFALLLPCLSAATVTSAEDNTIRRYCFACHNSTVKSGGLALEKLSVETAPDPAAEWEKVVRKLRGRYMPPAGAPRPTEAAYQNLLTRLETGLDRNAE